MCFWKSKQSKVLRAKRDIVVYKIGDKANKNTFVPYFIGSFKYLTGIKYQTFPDFKSNIMIEGYQFLSNTVDFLTYYEICSKSDWDSAVDRLNMWFKDASLKVKEL